MRKDDVLDVLRRMSPTDLTLTVLALRGGAVITVDVVIRAEQQFVIVRGREGGTTDEGRAFFIPYEEVVFIKLDKVVKTGYVKRMFGEQVALDAEEQVAADKAAKEAADEALTRPASPAAVAVGDAASVAKQNLLERIRAARTAAGGPASAAPNKPR